LPRSRRRRSPLARDGFAVEAHLADSIARNAELIRARPALAALLFRPDGTPLVAGDTLRQPQLAATLERIAAQGPSAFYAGDTAAAIADSVRAAGGVLTRRDLATYRPVWRQPVAAPFDGYTFFGMPPPSSGGGVMIEALNIMRADDLRALEHNSATYLHLLTESLQFAFADRAEFYGDPDVVRVPMATLTSPARGRDQRARISAPTTFSPQWYGTGALENDHGTSHLSIVDGAGNAVACTTSINTAFGSMVVGGDTGIILNDTMDDFSAQPGVPNVFRLIGSEANAIAPGKRPLSSMSPTIVTRGGQVAAVAGGSGGPLIITGTLQTLLNALVFGQDAMQAVSAARLHHQWTPPVLMVEPGIDGGTRQALVGLGHT
jgi:gamma-glutamyltranspeptidase/glutathione hydrolase